MSAPATRFAVMFFTVVVVAGPLRSQPRTTPSPGAPAPAAAPASPAAAPAPAPAAARGAASALEIEHAARAADAVSLGDATLALGAFARAASLVEHVPRAGAEQRFLDDVVARARHPIVRDHASFARARRSTRAGDVDAALKTYASLGFVPAVRAVGPFANTGGASFGAQLPSSDGKPVDVALLAASTAGDVNARVPGLERDIAWQSITLDPDGELDLVPRMTPVRETRAVIAFVVVADAAKTVALRAGSSGQLRVTLNKAEVLVDDADRPLGLDQSVAALPLAKGDNLVVVEAGFLGDDASLRLRLTAPDGTPLKGVKTSVDAAAFQRASRTKPTATATAANASAGAPPVVDPLAPIRVLLRESATSATPATNADASRISLLRAAAALETRLRAGDLRRRPRDLDLALSQLASALEGDGKSAPAAPAAVEAASARARLGDGLRNRDATAARRQLERALQLDPNGIEAMLALAALREEQGDDVATRAIYERARSVAPTSDLVARRRLVYLRDRGAAGVAVDIEVLRHAEKAPTEASVALAADVLEERGDVAGALAMLQSHGGREAARINRLKAQLAFARLPSDPTPARLLEERVALARELLRARPGNHSAAEALALALIAAGKADEAKALAADRVREMPERAEPRLLTARLALIRGDRETAQGALTDAQRLTPQDADIAAALRALSDERDELVARYGLDVDALAKLPAPPEAERIGAHVVASTTAIRFFDNGLGRVVTDRVMRVHDAKKAASLQTSAFPYSEGRERIEILVAERITKDGRREPAMRIVDQGPGGKEGGVYTDVAQKVVVLGQLADGDLIHLRTRKDLVGQQNLFGDFFGVIEPIQSFVPVERFRLVVEAPKNRALSFGGKNAPKPKITDVDGGFRVYDFQAPLTPALEPEPGMPPWLELADFVSVSTYATWEALGAWYERLVAPQLILDEELQRIARDAKASAKGDTAEIVRRLYEHVVTHTRYVGIELGIHGWKPYPVSEVHRRRFGDCKDKASLLVALLRAAGVDANIALVRTANVGHIEAEPASMWTFNHAIAYVPALDLFLDGTAEQSGWRELPTMDQGALSLIVGKHGKKSASELVTIPVAPADANLNVSDYVLTLGVDGALTVRGTEKFRGSHNAEQRRDFADVATRRLRLEKHLAQIMPGAQVRAIEVSDLALAAEDISYTFEATLPERASRETSGGLVMALSLYPHDVSGNYAQQSARKTDIFVDHPWRTRNVMRYVLPPGWSVESMPAGGSVKSEHLAFTQTITKTPDGFIVDEDTALLSRRIPVKDYAQFREAALRADALMKRTIRLVPGSSGAGTSASSAGGTR